MPKTVHLLGSGGPAGVGMTRCLKEWYEVTGWDDSEWARLMSEAETRNLPYELPDIIIPIPDSKVLELSELPRMFLPDESQIRLCQDKADTAKILSDLAPKTYWVRDTVGAGGKGAQMASELLPGRNYSQEFVYFDGEELAAFQKERVSYSVKERSAGLDNRGSSAVSVCTRRQDVLDTSREALRRIAAHTGMPLHGFYGVDLKEDELACPKVTEINAARLLTASYCYYYLTGYNLPLVGARAFLGEDAPKLPDYPVGYGIIRQVGQEPRLFGPEITKDWS